MVLAKLAYIVVEKRWPTSKQRPSRKVEQRTIVHESIQENTFETSKQKGKRLSVYNQFRGTKSSL